MKLKILLFSRQGATRIDPRFLSFCIATKMDKERDRMRRDPNLDQQLCNALVHAGYPSDAVPLVHFNIESQETVDRDYGEVGVKNAKCRDSGHEPS